MKRPISIGTLMIVAAGALTQAAEFTLEVKNMDLQEARSCPGGYGGFGQVSPTKPAELKKAPKAISAHPLYGQLQPQDADADAGATKAGMIFLFDESQGDSKGYDQMIADLNQNGDLTDDPVFKRLSDGRESSGPDFEQANFGPVELPANKAVGQWRPRFFAEIYLYNKQALRAATADERSPVGQLRIQAANYLETTVDVNGVRQKFGLVDGNCNFRMGDGARSVQVYRGSPGRESWYLTPGDFFLRDRDGTGKFERSSTSSDAEMYSKVIYFGSKPFAVTVAPDLKGIRFEPYADPVGEFAVKPELTELVLGWETKSGKWEALTPTIADGKAVVPQGTFRVSTCTVGAKSGSGRWIKAQSSNLPDKSYAVEAGKAAKLDFGLPLALEVTADKRDMSGEEAGGVMGAVRSLFGGSGGKQTMVRFNVVISGAGGEQYSGFMDEGNRGYVPPPLFEIVDSEGKQVASGKFEYG